MPIFIASSITWYAPQSAFIAKNISGPAASSQFPGQSLAGVSLPEGVVALAAGTSLQGLVNPPERKNYPEKPGFAGKE
jgi:hypothetical protein